MDFLNRDVELSQLRRALARDQKQFLVVYGRRRCGKSTLLRQLADDRTCYFLATEGDPGLQRSLLAARLDEYNPGFSLGNYDNWAIFFAALTARKGKRYTLVLDEFPYLLHAATELASILQGLVDDRSSMPFDLILCGSSQQMMETAILKASAPLYGRADEIIRLQPLAAGYLMEKFPALTAIESVKEYAIWGGVPRYWELRERSASLKEAVFDLLLRPTGLLIDEPRRLLLDDLTHLASPLSLLTLIAQGVNRISELGGRLSKTSADLTRPLARLTELGFIHREVPFGESTRSSKRTLYTVADPFMRFYHRFIIPNVSRIESGRAEEVWEDIASDLDTFMGATWEDLCRRAIAHGACGQAFDQCQRWWGNTTDRQPIELDGVSRSRDGKTLLLLECKWSENINPEAEFTRLQELSQRLPFYKGERIQLVLGLRKEATFDKLEILTPERVMSSLKH